MVCFTMKQQPFQVAECPQCGLARTYPPVPPEKLHEFYPPSYYGATNRRFHPLLERVVTFFRNRLGRKIQRLMPAGRVLDVGCGRGHLLAYLRAHGWQTHGTEFSDVAAEHARTVHGLDVVVGDFQTVAWGSPPFDVIILWHVLEHIPDPIAAVRRAGELLRDGGVLIVAVPNFASWQAQATGCAWFHLDIPRHVTHFKCGTLLQLLTQEGFVVERVNHFSAEQNVYGWLQSVYNRLGFAHNLLYSLLKTGAARDIPAPWRTHRWQVLAVVLLLPALLPLSAGLAVLEALFCRGGTIDLAARRQRRMTVPNQ